MVVAAMEACSVKDAEVGDLAAGTEAAIE